MVRKTYIALLLCCIANTAHGDPPQKPIDTDDHDGWYITVGPSAGMIRRNGEWMSSLGGEASLLFLDEHCTPALYGLSLGATAFAKVDSGRIYADLELAWNDPLAVPLGLAAGATYDMAPGGRRFGVHGTLWLFTGVVPFLRAAKVAGQSPSVEIGLMVKFPAIRFL